MTPEVLALLGMGLPALGYLARISHQLGAMTATQATQGARLDNHETRITTLENAA